MLSTTPYLHFMGNTEEAMTFYKSVLGGEFTIFHRFRDVPGSEKIPAEDQEKIIHASLTVNANFTLMATDYLSSMDQHLVLGNNFHICLHTESEAETERIFESLSRGGKVEMPLNTTFWGAYFGMFSDRFGVHWMLSFNAS
ncbi:VOC family protein [Chryseolinea lacunae]|uniref:VOC family protein n=1 Tax=Chryseolinea lacunae TaxID=2801331 RepID=A0ABS1L2K3_9BACT|nr:VOC family protein [Chryseolinea lacunae]MBL0745915.1 VOC family protein [Chryseolinea lacunae]